MRNKKHTVKTPFKTAEKLYETMVLGKPDCLFSEMVQTKTTLIMTVTLLPFQVLIIPRSLLRLCPNTGELAGLGLEEYSLAQLK